MKDHLIVPDWDGLAKSKLLYSLSRLPAACLEMITDYAMYFRVDVSVITISCTTYIKYTMPFIAMGYIRMDDGWHLSFPEDCVAIEWQQQSRTSPLLRRNISDQGLLFSKWRQLFALEWCHCDTKEGAISVVDKRFSFPTYAQFTMTNAISHLFETKNQYPFVLFEVGPWDQRTWQFAHFHLVSQMVGKLDFELCKYPNFQKHPPDAIDETRLGSITRQFEPHTDDEVVVDSSDSLFE